MRPWRRSVRRGTETAAVTRAQRGCCAAVRLRPRLRAREAARGDRAPPGRIPRNRSRAALHPRSDQGPRALHHRGGVRRADPAGTPEDGQPLGRDSGCQPRTAADRRTLRHEAVPAFPVRRRKRRGLERRHAPRARTGTEGPQEPVHHRAGVLRRRGSHARVDRHRSHVRQPPLCRDGPHVRHA